MEPWQPPIVANLLTIGALLAIAAWLRNRISVLQRIGIPDAIVAGAIGLALGPSVLDVAPFDTDQLETLVYHGFAVVFIAVGLQRAAKGAKSGATRSVMVAIPFVAVIQVTIGFIVVALFAGALHPGFGFLPMLGLSQGPGQALSIGGSWDALGLEDGGQLGLVFAALGFAVCCAIGVPLIAIGRHLGWDKVRGFGESAKVDEPEPAHEAPEVLVPGQMEPLTASLVACVLVYIGAFGLIYGLTRMLDPQSPLAATLWGFHFIAGALIAIGVRRLGGRVGLESAFNDRILARISVVAVDFTTVAALSAVKLGVLGRWWLPIVLVTLTCSLVTLFISLWIARRAFPERPFEHAVAMFGMSTGTLPTGLALVRVLDPGLRGPVARNVAFGATASIPLMAPLVVGVLPYSVTLWPDGLTMAVAIPLGLCAVYLVGLTFAWRTITPFRLTRPVRKIWPESERQDPRVSSAPR